MNLSLLLCLSAFCFAPLAYASDCGQSLDGAAQDPESAISPDDRAVRWLKDLLGPVTNWPVEDARAAVTRLLAGSRESPVSESAVSNNPDLQVHRQELAELMQEVSNPVAVGRALQEELERREGSTQRREETREEVELELYYRMKFAEIPPGTFSANFENNPYLIELPQRFWMMRVPVSLWQLGEVLPALKSDDQDSNSFTVSLSWLEAQAFVDELNQWARTNDPRLRRVVSGHQPTWRYSLPDAFEWMYVASNLAANSSGVEAWRQGSQVKELTLGGFTSMGQAARHYRSVTDSVTRQIAELDPMVIGGNEFINLGGVIQTWLHPNPFGTLSLPAETEAPRSRLLLRVQAPGVISKELRWFMREILNDNFYDSSLPVSDIKTISSKDAPILKVKQVSKNGGRATSGIRLIAFEADSETDNRLNPSTAVDEAATIARLGAAYLAFHIQSTAETIYALPFYKELRTNMIKVVYAAVKDWKQGRRNREFERTVEFQGEPMKLLEHPALDLRRFAHEVEAQLKARGVTP